MNQIEMTAELRGESGKGGARRLRIAGKIPAVVYGRGVETTPISLNEKELSDFLADGKTHNTLITLNVEGRKDLAKHLMIFREIQRHHIKRTPISADLLVIDRNRPITVNIPIHLRGVPKGEQLGGVLQHIAREVEIEAVPEMVPDLLEIDVSEMLPGDTLYVEDVEMPEGLTVNVKERTPICNLTIPRGYAEEEEKEEEAEEGEEEAEGAEGETEEKSEKDTESAEE